jgi:hypothetical protein
MNILYLAFVRFKNFELRSIFICFAFVKLNGTLNLDQSFYILPLSDFVTMNLHDLHMFCFY